MTEQSLIVTFYAPTEDPLFFEEVHFEEVHQVRLYFLPRVGEKVVIRIHEKMGSTTPETLGRWIVDRVVHNISWQPEAMDHHDVAIYLRHPGELE